MPWSRLAPADGSYTFQPGARYAVLASVSLDYPLADIQAKAEAQGFQVTYAWQEGQPATDPYLLGLSPDPTPNHRWIFAEGNFTGQGPWSLGVDSPTILFVHTTIWHIEAVFQAVAAEAPAPAPSPVATQFPPWAWAALALGVGAAAWAAWTYRDVYLPRPKTA